VHSVRFSRFLIIYRANSVISDGLCDGYYRASNRAVPSGLEG
jgi:hypothetical protein